MEPQKQPLNVERRSICHSNRLGYASKSWKNQTDWWSHHETRVQKPLFYPGHEMCHNMTLCPYERLRKRIGLKFCRLLGTEVSDLCAKAGPDWTTWTGFTVGWNLEKVYLRESAISHDLVVGFSRIGAGNCTTAWSTTGMNLSQIGPAGPEICPFKWNFRDKIFPNNEAS